MRVTNAFRMADRLLDGRLVEVLTAYRADGLGWEDIARHLFADYGIQVTSTTLRRWSGQLERDAAEGVA